MPGGMESSISSEHIRRLTPLLGSLARLVAAGVALSDTELEMLMVGVEVEPTTAVRAELGRWARLLGDVRENPVLRLVCVEALTQRGLPEATVLLAVDAVISASPTTAPASPTSVPSAAPAVAHLKASVSSLDLGTLPAGETGTAEFEVQGEPGQAVAQSDQVRVTPLQFGPRSTRLRVEVRPVTGGLLWTTIRLVAAGETVEIPVVAQWTSDPAIATSAAPVEPKGVASAPAHTTRRATVAAHSMQASPSVQGQPGRTAEGKGNLASSRFPPIVRLLLILVAAACLLILGGRAYVGLHSNREELVRVTMTAQAVPWLTVTAQARGTADALVTKGTLQMTAASQQKAGAQGTQTSLAEQSTQVADTAGAQPAAVEAKHAPETAQPTRAVEATSMPAKVQGPADAGAATGMQTVLATQDATETAEALAAGPDRYVPVALGSSANANVWFVSPPVGDISLDGIQFHLSGKVFKSQAAPSPDSTYPTSIKLPIGVLRASQLHILINSGNGFTWFSGKVIGKVVVFCDANESNVTDLVLGRDIREWHSAEDKVVSSASNPQQVWSGARSDHPELMGHIDMLSLSLPAGCQTGKLNAIEIVDTSADTVDSLDPAINVFGITVETYR